MSVKRYRTWRVIIYPDSCPEDYVNILDEMCFPWAESPLHDKDLNAADEEKKPHRHLVFFFEGPKSFEFVKLICDRLHAPIPKPADSPRGAVRYFVHLDDPDKYQYSISDIKCHKGAQIEQYFEYSLSQYRELTKSLFRWIRDQKFTEYSQLVNRLIDLGLDDWYDIATNRNTLAIKTYLASKRYSND